MKRILLFIIMLSTISNAYLFDVKHETINVLPDRIFCINRTINENNVSITPLYSSLSTKLISSKSLTLNDTLTYSYDVKTNIDKNLVSKEKINTKLSKNVVQFCFTTNESGYISFYGENQNGSLRENTTWLNVTYKWKKDIDCRFFNGHAAIINGSGGFSINGSQEYVWVKCENNLSLYFNNYNDYNIYNATDNVSYDVEGGNGTSRNQNNVWKNYIFVHHAVDYSQDSSGKGNGFTCTACPVSKKSYGYIGHGWYFNGSNVLTMGYNSSQDIGTDIAFMYIYKPDNDNGGRLIYRRSGEKGYAVYVYGSSYSNKQNFFTGSSTFGSLESSANAIQNYAWNVMFNTYNTSVGRLTVKNQSLSNSDSITSQLANPTSATLFVGAKDASFTESVTGYLDEFRLFNGPRTQQELIDFGKNIAGVDGYGTINSTISYESFTPYLNVYLLNNTFNTTANNISLFFMINGTNNTYKAYINYSNTTHTLYINSTILNNTNSSFNLSNLSLGTWFYNITGYLNDTTYNSSVTSNFSIVTTITTTTSTTTTTLDGIIKKIQFQDFTLKSFLRCCVNNTCVDVPSQNYTYIYNVSKCYEVAGGEKINTVNYVMQNIYLIFFLVCGFVLVFFIIRNKK